MNVPSARNVEKDREKGKQTELAFCALMNKHNCFTYRFQKGYPDAAVLQGHDEVILLPDVWVFAPWSTFTKQFFAEVKGKYPTSSGNYGLEEYRIEALRRIIKSTGVPVLYVIYDTKDEKWYWQSLESLLMQPYEVCASNTYVSGRIAKLPVYYFPKKRFIDVEVDGKLHGFVRLDFLG